MKSILSYSLLAAAMAAGVASAQPTTATTTPVGYTTISCLPGSDTIVSLPLRVSASAAGALTSVPSIGSEQAVLTVSGASFGSFGGTHYVKFKNSAAAEGKWFPVISNTADALTVDLNGNSLSAAIGDKIEILKFWTLSELFDPATATTSATTTPHAIVASLGTLTSQRRTQLLIPNFSGVGINVAPSTNYYIHDSKWKKAGSGDESFNNDQLWPDSYFIIRHPTTVTASTKFVASGEVELNSMVVSLATRASGQQDNFVGLPRPVDVKLNDLGLGGTAAFVSSTSNLTGGRRDQLLVFNNGVASQNKAPSSNYYFHNGIWKRAGNGDADVGNEVIPAGAGFIIRKYANSAATTDSWSNGASY